MTADWTTSFKGWEEAVIQGKSLVPVGALYPEEADAALDVFNSLKLVDVAGAPTFGSLALPWVTDFVRAVFGAYDPDTGRRKIREFFLLVSKKKWEEFSRRWDHAHRADPQLADVE